MVMIKRQDAIDALNECEEIKGHAYTSMHDALMEIPSIDIVSCQDCNKTEKRATELEGHKYCSMMLGWVEDTFFCGLGEVRDE